MQYWCFGHTLPSLLMRLSGLKQRWWWFSMFLFYTIFGWFSWFSKTFSWFFIVFFYFLAALAALYLTSNPESFIHGLLSGGIPVSLKSKDDKCVRDKDWGCYELKFERKWSYRKSSRKMRFFNSRLLTIENVVIMFECSDEFEKKQALQKSFAEDCQEWYLWGSEVIEVDNSQHVWINIWC